MKNHPNHPGILWCPNHPAAAKGGGDTLEGLGSRGAATRAVPEARWPKRASRDAQIAQRRQLPGRRSLGSWANLACSIGKS